MAINFGNTLADLLYNLLLKTKKLNYSVPVTYGDTAALDAFGRLRVANPETIFDSKQIFDNQPLIYDDSEVSGGSTTSTHSTDTASSTIGVALNTAGRRVRQTFQRFNYQPAKSQLIFLTGTIDKTGGGTGITRGFGIYDDDNGVFVRDNEGTLEMVIRSSTSGSAVNNAVSQDNWNLDKLDGTGDSGVTLDTTKSIILAIDFEWLGVGRVRTGFVIGGKVIYVHEFLHSNQLAGVYMSTPNLPIRYEIENDGTGAASTLEHICSTVISEGGVQTNGVIRSASTGGTHLDADVENTIYAVLGIRLKSTHIGATINLLTFAMQIQTASENVEWSIRFNPTVGDTFSYLGETNSAIEVATGDTLNTVTDGVLIDSGFFSSTSGGGGSGNAEGALETALRLGAAIDGTVDEIVLCARPIGGSTGVDIEASITWRELQ